MAHSPMMSEETALALAEKWESMARMNLEEARGKKFKDALVTQVLLEHGATVLRWAAKDLRNGFGLPEQP